MGMGMNSLKWEGIGTKNLFPHTSTLKCPISPLAPTDYMWLRGCFFHFKLVHRSLGSFEDDACHMKCMHHDHSCYAYVGQQVKPCLGLYVMNTYHCV